MAGGDTPPGGDADSGRDAAPGREESDAGWAAPSQPSRDPDEGTEPTAPSAPPPAPPAPPAPSAAWAATAPGATPPPPPPVPGAAGPAGPTRRIWLYLLIALVGVGVLAVIAGTVLFVDRTVPPYDAATNFLDDLVDRRTADARSQLCAADRERGEAAIGAVTRHFLGGTTVFANPLGVDRDGSRATVDYTIDIRGVDDDLTYELPLVEEGGEWRPCPLSG